VWDCNTPSFTEVASAPGRGSASCVQSFHAAGLPGREITARLRHDDEAKAGEGSVWGTLHRYWQVAYGRANAASCWHARHRGAAVVDCTQVSGSCGGLRYSIACEANFCKSNWPGLLLHRAGHYTTQNLITERTEHRALFQHAAQAAPAETFAGP
jgi:esterase/lipase superfamily enzyme